MEILLVLNENKQVNNAKIYLVKTSRCLTARLQHFVKNYCLHFQNIRRTSVTKIGAERSCEYWYLSIYNVGTWLSNYNVGTLYQNLILLTLYQTTSLVPVFQIMMLVPLDQTVMLVLVYQPVSHNVTEKFNFHFWPYRFHWRSNTA